MPMKMGFAAGPLVRNKATFPEHATADLPAATPAVTVPRRSARVYMSLSILQKQSGVSLNSLLRLTAPLVVCRLTSCIR